MRSTDDNWQIPYMILLSSDSPNVLITEPLCHVIFYITSQEMKRQDREQSNEGPITDWLYSIVHMQKQLLYARDKNNQIHKTPRQWTL